MRGRPLVIGVGLAGFPLGRRRKSGPEDATVRYIIETTGSAFTVRAFVTGLLSSFGHDPTISLADFTGEVSLHPEAIEQSTLRMVIAAASLRTSDDASVEASAKDLADINRKMHKEVLESEAFPQIVYECTRVSGNKIGEGEYWVVLNGELILHGVARSQAVTARVSVNGDQLRARGDFSLRQSEYAIRPVSAAGGTIRIKDEVKLSFDICARKQS